jgi:hypothetical protein
MTPTALAARDDSTLARVIATGVPGTAMMGFEGTGPRQLRPDDIRLLVAWMRAQGGE